jgi:hypothetical protein
MLDSIDSNSTADPGERRAESSVPARPAISKSEIEWVNACHGRIVRSDANTLNEMIEAGKHLASMKERVKRRGEPWEEFVAGNLRFPIRTAQRYMEAFEIGPTLLLAGVGPVEILAKIWGNEKRRNVVSGKREKKEKDKKGDNNNNNNNNNRQSGGLSFYPDSENPGKLVVADFETLTGIIDREVFENESVTAPAKRAFVRKLVAWLRERMVSLGALEKEGTE